MSKVEIVKDHPELKEIIYDFYKMRERIKHPIATESALMKVVNDAIKLGEGDPDKIRQIFENSVAYSWRGVFALKEDQNNTPAASTPIVKDDNPFRNMDMDDYHRRFGDL